MYLSFYQQVSTRHTGPQCTFDSAVNPALTVMKHEQIILYQRNDLGLNIYVPVYTVLPYINPKAPPYRKQHEKQFQLWYEEPEA